MSRRPAFWIAIAVEVGLLVAIIVIPPLRRLFHTQPLPGIVIAGLLGLPLLMVAVEVMVRVAQSWRPRPGTTAPSHPGVTSTAP